MLQIFTRLLTLSLLMLSGLAIAAPNKVDVVYQATRNGQPFATVTESYQQANGRYRIESVTKGIGVYALLGERRLTSEGEVTSEGLKPGHFELHQGDNEKRALYADFDWTANVLTMKIKGKAVTAPLEKGTQDLVSFAYQFMFAKPQGDALELSVTTGKKLRIYRYTVTDRDAIMQLPAGAFKTMHLIKADKDDQSSEKQGASDGKELWLGAEAYSLPVRLLLVDENGTKTEQTITSLHAD
jgi:Protein of unknown function (DUF3108)